MQEPTAQIAALTCYLNARKRGIATRHFFPGNSTCQFCEFIHFLHPRRRRWFGRDEGWDVIATTADDWLESVALDGLAHAVLIRLPGGDPRLPDRKAAGFVGGGGRWRLCLHRKRSVGCWEAGWELGNREAADRRIWRVRYVLVADEQPARPAALSVDELGEHLPRCLTDIEAFARQHDLECFAECFAKAQKCLTSDNPLALVHHRDLAPDGALERPAARLLAACQAAWVFGGMGSWNDVGFNGPERTLYCELSDRLFDLLTQAICAAVNTTAGA
ncbi:MAG TPA: hypothetical protein PKK06_05710 [Phycisphaerae bacterium]|nr:hypothetical protein [Phycisphaerae bacterium]HNU44308.1 hypothetical protein [Phycisphaerae bacterium]